jgi:hypothetical protein
VAAVPESDDEEEEPPLDPSAIRAAIYTRLQQELPCSGPADFAAHCPPASDEQALYFPAAFSVDAAQESSIRYTDARDRELNELGMKSGVQTSTPASKSTGRLVGVYTSESDVHSPSRRQVVDTRVMNEEEIFVDDEDQLLLSRLIRVDPDRTAAATSQGRRRASPLRFSSDREPCRYISNSIGHESASHDSPAPQTDPFCTFLKLMRKTLGADGLQMPNPVALSISLDGNTMSKWNRPYVGE